MRTVALLALVLLATAAVPAIAKDPAAGPEPASGSGLDPDRGVVDEELEEEKEETDEEEGDAVSLDLTAELAESATQEEVKEVLAKVGITNTSTAAVTIISFFVPGASTDDCATIVPEEKQTELDEALLLAAYVLGKTPLTMTHFCSEPAGAARRRRAEGNKPGVVISSETMLPLGASEKISDLAAAFAAEAEKIKITFTHADESTEYSVGFVGTALATYDQLVSALEGDTDTDSSGAILQLVLSDEMQARIEQESKFAGGTFGGGKSSKGGGGKSGKGKGGKSSKGKNKSGKSKGKKGHSGGSTQLVAQTTTVSNSNFFSGGTITILNYKEADEEEEAKLNADADAKGGGGKGDGGKGKKGGGGKSSKGGGGGKSSKGKGKHGGSTQTQTSSNSGTFTFVGFKKDEDAADATDADRSVVDDEEAKLNADADAKGKGGGGKADGGGGGKGGKSSKGKHGGGGGKGGKSSKGKHGGSTQTSSNSGTFTIVGFKEGDEEATAENKAQEDAAEETDTAEEEETTATDTDTAEEEEEEEEPNVEGGARLRADADADVTAEEKEEDATDRVDTAEEEETQETIVEGGARLRTDADETAAETVSEVVAGMNNDVADVGEAVTEVTEGGARLRTDADETAAGMISEVVAGMNNDIADVGEAVTEVKIVKVEAESEETTQAPQTTPKVARAPTELGPPHPGKKLKGPKGAEAVGDGDHPPGKGSKKGALTLGASVGSPTTFAHKALLPESVLAVFIFTVLVVAAVRKTRMPTMLEAEESTALLPDQGTSVDLEQIISEGAKYHTLNDSVISTYADSNFVAF